MTTFKIAAAPSPIPASTADNASARGAQSSPSLASSLGISRHGQRQRAIAQQLLSRSTPARPPAISLLSSRGGGGGRSGSISPKEGESENRTLAQPQSPSPSSSALVPCTPVVGRISRVGDGGRCRQNSVSSTATIAIITSNNDRSIHGRATSGTNNVGSAQPRSREEQQQVEARTEDYGDGNDHTFLLPPLLSYLDGQFQAVGEIGANVGQQEGEKARDTGPSTAKVVEPVHDEKEGGAVVPPSPLPHDGVGDDDDRDAKFTRQFLNECCCEERAWQCWHWTIEYQPYDPNAAEYVHDVEKMLLLC